MGIKIAIIEDDAMILKLYDFEFKKLGYDVKTAVNGQLGLQLIQEFRPAIILLDLNMPVMNGVDMLTTLRSQEWGKHFKVIVLTNQDREQAPSVLDNMGISRYVVKAEYTADQIADIVKEVLETRP